MGIEKIQIERFLALAEKLPVLDVRSPAEFGHAHIPAAHSLPLFTDEERKIVGTAYKHESREAAIKKGLDFFGPRMRMMVETAEKITAGPGDANSIQEQPAVTRSVLVHCWRGGMRSAGVAWLLDLYGFKVYTLAGGYKAFRNWVLQQVSLPYKFRILGGYTGSGKTEVLHELGKKQELVIDLEALAGHKGSAFGNIGLPPQPSQEMFENKLALALKSIYTADVTTLSAKPVWLEDESLRIGTINIPQTLWLNMRSSAVYFLDVSFEQRLEHLVEEYGQLDREHMLDAISRLQKRLGGLETKTAIACLNEDNVKECFRILLKYYDKYYQKALNNRERPDEMLFKIQCNSLSAVANADAVVEKIPSTPAV